MLGQKRNLQSTDDPAQWLETEILAMKQRLLSEPYIPIKRDGSHYELNDLFDDQKWIAFIVLQKIKEFLESDDLTSFEPLRITIDGKGGTGKSVLLNTIASVLRKATDCNDSCVVGALTGTAAFNVNGETIHSFALMSQNDIE